MEGDGLFKRCPMCDVAWSSREGFLSDPAVAVAGYQVNFDDLVAGFFLFQHTCGTSLGIRVGAFRDLYDGEVFEAVATGTEECPGYCLRIQELEPCPAECECAYVREVLQVVRNWPKAQA